MFDSPLVTVIIPNYNHSEFLEKRILSVLDQTYLNYEIIILDDRSSDGSKEIIALFKGNSKIKEVVLNRKNSGSVFKQWVKGIDLATGKYVWIAESDDFADADFLKNMVSLAEKNPTAGFLFSDSYNVDRNSKILEKVSSNHPQLKTFSEDHKVFPAGYKASIFFISDMLILNASSVLFNLEKFKSKVEFKTLQNFKNCGDRFVYLSIYLNFDMIYLNDPLNYRRDHDNNVTKSNFSSGLIYKERIKIVNYFFKNFKNNIQNHLAFHNYLKGNFLPVVDHGFYKEMAKLNWKFYTTGLISGKFFYKLSIYTLIAKVSKNNPPYILRRMVKDALNKKQSQKS